MKKMILVLFAAVMLLTVCIPAMAVNEDVEGERKDRDLHLHVPLRDRYDE